MHNKALLDLPKVQQAYHTMLQIRKQQLSEKSTQAINLIPVLITLTETCPEATDVLIRPLLKACRKANRKLSNVIRNTSHDRTN